MKNSIAGAVGICGLALLGLGCASADAPSRPSNVPAEAVWSGGPDGGAWVDCRFAVKEPFTGFDCDIWDDYGHPWSSGTFAVWVDDGGEWHPRAGDLFAEFTHFTYYNGETIIVSDHEELRPTGWIDYPFGEGHGKRGRYEDGREVEEQSY